MFLNFLWLTLVNYVYMFVNICIDDGFFNRFKINEKNDVFNNYLMNSSILPI